MKEILDTSVIPPLAPLFTWEVVQHVELGVACDLDKVKTFI